MSIKNKAKDRNANGRIKRKYTGPARNTGVHCFNGTPSWFVNMFMNRPKRRRNRHACHLIRKDVNSENMAFELGNRKPHEYYW